MAKPNKKFTQPEIYFGCKRISGLSDSKQPKDITSDWFIYWNHYRESSGKFERVRVRGGINRYHTISERWSEAKICLKAQVELLHEGYYPWPGDLPKDISLSGQSHIITFTNALDIAWSIKEPLLRKASRPDYKSCLGYFKKKVLELNIGGYMIQSITRRQVRFVLESMQKERGYGDRRYNNVLTNISAIFSVLVDEDIIENNPCLKIKKKRLEDSNYFETLSFEDRIMIKDELQYKQPGFFLFISFIRHLGIRRTEATKLKRKNITDTHIVITGDISKVGKKRVMPILDEFKDLLWDHLDKCESGEDYLFSNNFLPGPAQTHPDTATGWWNKYIVKGLGINKKMYALKHTAATLYIDSGANPSDVAELFGHSNTQMLKHSYAPSAIERQAAKSIIEHSEGF